jgi:teichuronic acid biosynthesis protein TuaF
MLVLKNDFVKNIFNRMKRLAILLILLPILTAITAYFLQPNTSVSYTGTAEIMLGNFQKESLTHQELMRDQIPNRAFLAYLDEEHSLDMDVDFVASNLSVLAKPGKILEFTMSGSDKAKINEQLEVLIKGFIAESDKVQQEQITLIEEKIAEVEAINASNEELISKERFIYDLSEKLNTLEMPTVVNKEVQVATTDNNNPMQRAILGFLVGIMINIIILIFPELFKEEK